MLRTRHALAVTAWCAAWSLAASLAAAQDLTPRAYWPAPVGTNVIAVGYAYQTGDVVTDPARPIEGADSESHGLQAGYVRFFSLAGRTASVTVEIPRAEAQFTGLVNGEPAKRKLAGHSDASVRLAVNLRGAPGMTPHEFGAFRESPEPVLGISLELQAPTGGYDEDRFVNLGTNRWVARPEIGYIHPIRPGYIFEASLGAALYEDNDEFQGQVLEQEPLVGGKIHLIRRIRPGLWTSLDLTYYFGGRTTVDGERSDDRQENTRIGATVAFPFPKAQAIRFAASTSLGTAAGGDFTAYLLSYSRAW